jgi:hypothetical protein
MVELGTDERGVRRRKCVSCASEGDAKRVKANLTSEVFPVPTSSPRRRRWLKFLDEWRSRAGRGGAQRTKDHYKITCENHPKPALGRVKLAQLKPLHIKSFMTAQVEQNGVSSFLVDHRAKQKLLARAVSTYKDQDPDAH